MRVKNITVYIFLITLLTAPSLVNAQDEAELHPGREYAEPYGLPDPDYQPAHRTSYLLERPEIREAYQEYLDRADDPELMKQAELRFQEFEPGDTKVFNVINFEESEGSSDSYDEIEFELADQSEHVRLWVEQDELGEDQVSDSVISGMMEVLSENTPSGSVNPELGLYELNNQLFGDYPNIDGSDKLNVLITDIQEADRGDERNLITLGFFNPIDLYPGRDNSNGADIIYINSNPFIYGGNFAASDWHSTLSHEIQHLIHGNADYARLNIFQNEGQSEMAEILTGFQPRPMTFLSQPEERTGIVETTQTNGLFRWRQGRNEVIQDYERAGLLHTYIAERIGEEDAGSITRGSRGINGYQNALSGEGLDWQEVLVDFHVANLINRNFKGEEAFKYSFNPTLENLRVRNFPRIYNASQARFVQNREVELQYGGVKYTRWLDVSDLELRIESGRGIRHKVWYRTASDDSHRLETLESGTHHFDEDIINMTLISINTDPGGNEERPSPRTFTYAGEWEPGETLVEQLNYAANEPQSFFSLSTDDPATPEVAAQRISPSLTGGIEEISFRIRRHEDAVRGNGKLQIGLTESESRDGDPFPIPVSIDNPIKQTEIEFSEIGEGMNSVDLEDLNWSVDRHEEYFITYSVVSESDEVQLQFIADDGETEELLNDEETRDFYQPARTLVLTGNRQWRSFENNNNLYMNTEIHGVDPDFEPDLREPPIADDQFKLKQNYPNPFNPQTTITYSLFMEIDVTLEVYDVTGRKITTLVDERQEAGSYDLQFDASEYNLSTGMYLYRMQAGSFSDTGKMMFVK